MLRMNISLLKWWSCIWLVVVLSAATGSERRAYHDAFDVSVVHDAMPQTVHVLAGKNTNALDFQPGTALNANVTLRVLGASGLADEANGLTIESWIHHRGCDPKATAQGQSCLVMWYGNFRQRLFTAISGGSHPTNFTTYSHTIVQAQLGDLAL